MADAKFTFGSYIKIGFLTCKNFIVRVSRVDVQKNGGVIMTMHNDLIGFSFNCLIAMENVMFAELSNEKKAIRYAKNHPEKFTPKALNKIGLLLQHHDNE